MAFLCDCGLPKKAKKTLQNKARALFAEERYIPGKVANGLVLSPKQRTQVHSNPHP